MTDIAQNILDEFLSQDLTVVTIDDFKDHFLESENSSHIDEVIELVQPMAEQHESFEWLRVSLEFIYRDEYHATDLQDDILNCYINFFAMASAGAYTLNVRFS